MRILIVLLLSLPAQAAPWRYETGLPRPDDALVATVDGVEHPHLDWKGFTMGLQGDAFINYRLDWRQGTFFHEFELSRVQLGGFVAYKQLAGLQIGFESVRSSGGQSYFGIDGNSIVTRFKYAFAEVTPWRHWISLRGGIIPDLMLSQVEASWTFRVQGQTGLERDNIFVAADLGASLEVALPWALGSVAVAYQNGEAYNLNEQNNGKNTTAVLRIAPGRWKLPQLSLQILYRDGSVGVAQAADHRFGGGVVYSGRRLGAGALAFWAIGWRGNGARDAGYLTLWARGELPLRFFLFGRLDALWPDARDAGATQLRAVGGLGWALPALVRILISYEGTYGTGAVVNQVPAVDEQLLQISLEARL